jgi:hypothetical protein
MSWDRVTRLWPPNILVSCGLLGFPRCYADRAAAYSETDAAYHKFKAGPLRLARYCNGLIVTHDRAHRQINEKGAQTTVVRGLS